MSRRAKIMTRQNQPKPENPNEVTPSEQTVDKPPVATKRQPRQTPIDPAFMNNTANIFCKLVQEINRQCKAKRRAQSKPDKSSNDNEADGLNTFQDQLKNSQNVSASIEPEIMRKKIKRPSPPVSSTGASNKANKQKHVSSVASQSITGKAPVLNKISPEAPQRDPVVVGQPKPQETKDYYSFDTQPSDQNLAKLLQSKSVEKPLSHSVASNPRDMPINNRVPINIFAQNFPNNIFPLMANNPQQATQLVNQLLQHPNYFNYHALGSSLANPQGNLSLMNLFMGAPLMFNNDNSRLQRPARPQRAGVPTNTIIQNERKIFKRATYHIAIAYHIHLQKFFHSGQLKERQKDQLDPHLMDPTYRAKMLREQNNLPGHDAENNTNQRHLSTPQHNNLLIQEHKTASPIVYLGEKHGTQNHSQAKPQEAPVQQAEADAVAIEQPVSLVASVQEKQQGAQPAAMQVQVNQPKIEESKQGQMQVEEDNGCQIIANQDLTNKTVVQQDTVKPAPAQVPESIQESIQAVAVQQPLKFEVIPLPQVQHVQQESEKSELQSGEIV